jgi:hypothetical protein
MDDDFNGNARFIVGELRVFLLASLALGDRRGKQDLRLVAPSTSIAVRYFRKYDEFRLPVPLWIPRQELP